MGLDRSVSECITSFCLYFLGPLELNVHYHSILSSSFGCQIICLIHQKRPSKPTFTIPSVFEPDTYSCFACQ
uniref:Uncharacterized protein n=1 Tax=Rhizophora mucronata TaxID=61149 RepID=A0A2P2NJL6_RHIMU